MVQLVPALRSAALSDTVNESLQSRNGFNKRLVKEFPEIEVIRSTMIH